MILTNRKKSPVKAGIYKAKILDIKEYEHTQTKFGPIPKLVYSFAVFTKEGIVELKTNMFINNNPNSKFSCFKWWLLKNFNTDTLETKDHIGLTVKVKFNVKTNQNGDEYLQLVWYAPYEEISENIENNGGNKDAK